MNIGQLLDPVPLVRFIGEFWERQALHVPRARPGHYDELLTLEEIDGQLFGNRNLTSTCLKLCRGREELAPNQWSEKAVAGDLVTTVVSPDKLRAAFRQGYGLYLNFAERIFPRLSDRMSALERDLKVKALSHLILTPPRTQGFLPHTDPYGVFVLQLSGAKRWHSYGLRDALPSQGFNHHHLTAEPASETFELRAGDLLYLPRGTAHSAATAHSHSIHLSLALLPARGIDLMHLIEAIAERQPFFQEYIPYGFAAAPELQPAYAQRFKERLIELIQHTDVFDLLDRHHRTTTALPRTGRPLSDLFGAEVADTEGARAARND